MYIQDEAIAYWEQFLMDFGLTIGITFGDYSCSIYPSHRFKDTGNITFHFNCNCDKLEDTIRKYLLANNKVEKVFSIEKLDMYKMAWYESPFKYRIHIKTKL